MRNKICQHCLEAVHVNEIWEKVGEAIRLFHRGQITLARSTVAVLEIKLKECTTFVRINSYALVSSSYREGDPTVLIMSRLW
jgi:hypothetical protein